MVHVLVHVCFTMMYFIGFALIHFRLQRTFIDFFSIVGFQNALLAREKLTNGLLDNHCQSFFSFAFQARIEKIIFFFPRAHWCHASLHPHSFVALKFLLTLESECHAQIISRAPPISNSIYQVISSLRCKAGCRTCSTIL